MSAEDLGTRIWADVPELTQLAAALQSVRHRITLCMTREPEAPHLARRRLLHALVAGEPLPEDLGRRLHEESLTAEYHARELNVLQNLVTDLGTELSAARAAGADTALAVLDAELHQVLGEVRALEPALRNVASADDAVHVGGDAVTAWQALTHLTGRYQRCRGLQINVTADALGDRHTATGLVERNRYANRHEHQPLKAYLADGTDVAPSEPAYPSGTEHVRWMARTDVIAWVPSTADLQGADDTAQQAKAEAEVARATTNGQAGPQADARHQHQHQQNQNFITARKLANSHR